MILPESHMMKLGKDVFRAYDHPFRQRIIKYLLAHPGAHQTQLRIEFRCDQSTIAQQIAVLRNAGFIATKKKGKWYHYHVREEMVDNFRKAIQLITVES